MLRFSLSTQSMIELITVTTEMQFMDIFLYSYFPVFMEHHMNKPNTFLSQIGLTF